MILSILEENVRKVQRQLSRGHLNLGQMSQYCRVCGHWGPLQTFLKLLNTDTRF